MAAVKRDGRLIRSRSLWGAEGPFADLTTNVPEAVDLTTKTKNNKK